jgi:hypothetical protein
MTDRLSAEQRAELAVMGKLRDWWWARGERTRLRQKIDALSRRLLSTEAEVVVLREAFRELDLCVDRNMTDEVAGMLIRIVDGGRSVLVARPEQWMVRETADVSVLGTRLESVRFTAEVLVDPRANMGERAVRNGIVRKMLTLWQTGNQILDARQGAGEVRE